MNVFFIKEASMIKIKCSLENNQHKYWNKLLLNLTENNIKQKQLSYG